MNSCWEEKKSQKKPGIDFLNIAPGHEMTDILYYEKEIDHYLQNRFIILCLNYYGLNKHFVYTVSFFRFYFTLNMLFTVKFSVPERIIFCIWKAIAATVDPKLASLSITAPYLCWS